VVRGELDAYGAGLEDKDEVIALSKIDAVDAKTLTKLAKKLEKASGRPVLRVSAAAGDGVEAVLDRLVESVGRARPDEAGDRPWTPV
jgi:GTP-binding protein